MIIDYIHLENFLSHRDSMIRFEKGVNIIYGKNGAGKSSLVDAIRFALFGEKRGDKIAELIRSGEKECSVTIGFRLNERYYEVYRYMQLGGSGVKERKAWIRNEGEMVAETAEGVTKEIQSGLGIPKDTFLNSVFVRQGEMDSLISETARKREELFSKIIGIDILSESAQKVKAIRDRLRYEEARYSSLSESLEKNSMDMESAGKDATDARAAMEDLEKEGENAAALLEKADSARTAMLEKKARFDAVTGRVREVLERERGLRNSIDAKKRTMEELKSSVADKEQIESSPLFKNRSHVSAYFRAKEEMKALDVSLENMRARIREYEEEKGKLSQLSGKHSRYLEVEEGISSLEGKVKELQEARTVYRSIADEISRERERAKELAKSISSPSFNDIRGLDRKALDEQTSREQEVLRKTEGERKALMERKENIKKMLEELRKNKETLGNNQECPVCGTILKEDRLNEIHSTYEEKERQSLSEIESSDSRISELGREYEEANSRLERLRKPDVERLISSREEIERIRAANKEREKKIPEHKEKAEKLESLENDLGAMKKELNELKPLENMYNQVVYAIQRIPADEIRERLGEGEKEKESVTSRIAEVVRTIGFEPAQEDRDRLDGLVSRYEKIRSSDSEYQKVSSEIMSQQEQVEELHNELAQKRSEIEEMGDVASQLSSAVEEYSRTQQAHSDVRQRIAALLERIRSLEESMRKLEGENAQLRKQGEKLAVIRAGASKLEKIRASFDRNGIQALIRKDSSVSINNMTRNYLASFNFDFDDVRIDENFDIRVINNGVEEALDSLSGGERISLAIAVRLAIAKYLTGRVSTVIMDEPTNFLDEDRRNNLKDIIKYSLKDENMVQQMIMITHHAELTSAADLSLEVTKSGGVSTVGQG